MKRNEKQLAISNWPLAFGEQPGEKKIRALREHPGEAASLSSRQPSPFYFQSAAAEDRKLSPFHGLLHEKPSPFKPKV